MSVYQKLDGIAETVKSGQADAIKADKGNVAAGRRLRKLLQEVRAQCVALRATILEKQSK
jgi:hypothetical protein